MIKNSIIPAKPFLKWAGGKSQLLTQFESFYPRELDTGEITNYVEPFLGGGAVLLYIIQKYENLQKAYVFDNNKELVLPYLVIKRRTDELIAHLEDLATKFIQASGSERSTMFYDIRAKYNQNRPPNNFNRLTGKDVDRAAQMIFLNKTCYNGLFRLNRDGAFNVPFGRYKNPRILDRDNLKRVGKLLTKVEILYGDFEDCEQYINERTLVYFDPPYRPISPTSNFTSYSSNGFDESQQIRLAKFFRKLDKKFKARLMLSNSDPSQENPDDLFFYENYKGFYLNEVSASRMINSNAKRRGQIKELLITNFTNQE